MRTRIACNVAPNHEFVVVFEVQDAMGLTAFSLATYADENEFILRVVESFTDNEQIMMVVSHALLAVAGRNAANSWIELHCPEEELLGIGLSSQPATNHHQFEPAAVYHMV